MASFFTIENGEKERYLGSYKLVIKEGTFSVPLLESETRAVGHEANTQTQNN